MITVTLYTRKECQLCEDAHRDLDELRKLIPHRLVTVDVDGDPQIQKDYGLEIPVVEVGPFKLKAPFTRQDLQVTLSAARDRERHIYMVENSPKLNDLRQSTPWTFSDSVNLFLSRHYMGLFNLLVVIYLGMAMLAPVLAKARIELPANLLYRAYGFVCHQLAYRSFFILGDSPDAQPFYPREAAGVTGYQTFQQVTGLSEGGDGEAVLIARQFRGSDPMGYKIALCERDLAIYFGILLFGVVFSLTGFRIRSIPWWVWLALAIVPIGLDGFSQLLSQPPLSLFPYRESTPTLRVLTGFLFGFLTAWFGYPLVEESMVDTRRLATAKWNRIHKSIEKAS